ncbi:hypothetical protein Q7C36_003146 [Tachysurus vachellii]|uniref:Uncharacterized protein n=1 Tax=Tachysurus vachellii TaxID=175792 RepID=A0AA88NUL6_TACVA|nr:hypothetical protein Q7C36_003146 [Tachysurus vachellii]
MQMCSLPHAQLKDLSSILSLSKQHDSVFPYGWIKIWCLPDFFTQILYVRILSKPYQSKLEKVSNCAAGFLTVLHHTVLYIHNYEDHAQTVCAHGGCDDGETTTDLNVTQVGRPQCIASACSVLRA